MKANKKLTNINMEFAMISCDCSVNENGAFANAEKINIGKPIFKINSFKVFSQSSPTFVNFCKNAAAKIIRNRGAITVRIWSTFLRLRIYVMVGLLWVFCKFLGIAGCLRRSYSLFIINQFFLSPMKKGSVIFFVGLKPSFLCPSIEAVLSDSTYAIIVSLPISLRSLSYSLVPIPV